MIIRKAKFRKVKKIVTERISDDIYGCDECKKEIKSSDSKLDISVFYHNKKLKKQQNSGDTDSHEFCSWNCVCKFLPKIKTDYFVSLPFLHYEKQTEGTMANDFIKLLTCKK